MEDLMVTLEVRREVDEEWPMLLHYQVNVKCDADPRERLVHELRGRMTSFVTDLLAGYSPSVNVVVTDYVQEEARCPRVSEG